MLAAVPELKGLRVLLADPREAERSRLAGLLARGRLCARVETAADACAAREKLAAGVDLLLVSQRLPDEDGVSLLEAHSSASGGPPPAILLVEAPDQELALRALRAGAMDCLVRGELTRERLDQAIRFGLERWRERRDRELVHRDLTGAHQALLRSRGALERTCGELERFASAAAHDLQEPLRTLRFLGERLAAHPGASLDERGRDYLDRLLLTSARMQDMLRQTLLLARLIGADPSPRHVALDALLESVRGDLAAALEQTGASLEVERLPVVRGCESQLRRLFQNLLGNALKFASAARPPHVRVRALPIAPDAGEAVIEVQDDGVGFPAELARELFVPFRRLHSRERGAGHGIGLAICRAIVENHGGEISASGAPERGATFTLTLPLAGPPSPALRERAGARARAAAWRAPRAHGVPARG